MNQIYFKFQWIKFISNSSESNLFQIPVNQIYFKFQWIKFISNSSDLNLFQIPVTWIYFKFQWLEFISNSRKFDLVQIPVNWIYYASPISGDAYRDRRLTTNFELWVEIFCVPTCFHMRIPKPCLSVCLSVRPSVCPSVRPSVCPHPEKGNPLSFVNISPTLVIDASMERSSRVLRNGNPKIWFFFIKVWNSKFDFWRRAEITLASSISVLH